MNNAHFDFTTLDSSIARAEALYPAYAAHRPQLHEDATLAETRGWLQALQEYTHRILEGRTEELTALYSVGASGAVAQQVLDQRGALGAVLLVTTVYSI